jgi:hypothetical protein
MFAGDNISLLSAFPAGGSAAMSTASLLVFDTLLGVLTRSLPPARPFEVRLRHHTEGTPMADDQTYTWSGQATDEAHAVVLAKRAAADDGWEPGGPIGYRVVETGGFLPVAHEWVDRAS